MCVRFLNFTYFLLNSRAKHWNTPCWHVVDTCSRYFVSKHVGFQELPFMFICRFGPSPNLPTLQRVYMYSKLLVKGKVFSPDNHVCNQLYTSTIVAKYIKLVKKCKICQYFNNSYNKNMMGMSDLGFRSDQAIYYHTVPEKTTKFLWRITLLLITHPGFGGRITLMSYDKPDLHIQSSIYILTIKER